MHGDLFKVNDKHETIKTFLYGINKPSSKELHNVNNLVVAGSPCPHHITASTSILQRSHNLTLNQVNCNLAP